MKYLFNIIEYFVHKTYFENETDRNIYSPFDGSSLYCNNITYYNGIEWKYDLDASVICKIVRKLFASLFTSGAVTDIEECYLKSIFLFYDEDYKIKCEKLKLNMNMFSIDFTEERNSILSKIKDELYKNKKLTKNTYKKIYGLNINPNIEQCI